MKATRRNTFVTGWLVLFLLVPAMPAIADNEDEDRRILTVSASGEERIDATRAEIGLGVESQGDTAELARERLAEATSSLLDFLRGAEVEQLRTTALRLLPVYDSQRQPRTIVGFRATSTVSFRVPAERAGAVIDQAIAEGANRVERLNFTATEERMEEARQQAMRSATRLAIERADAVLDELGLERKEVIRVRLEAMDFPRPMMMMEARTMDAPATAVEPGEQQISASVTLEIAY